MTTRLSLACLVALGATLWLGCPSEPPFEPPPDAFRMRRDAGPDAPSETDADVDADIDADLDAAASVDDAFAPDAATDDTGVPIDGGMDGGAPPCTASSECRDPALPVCDGRTGECIECSDVERGACAADEFCDAGRCAMGCAMDADCTGTETHCRTSDHLCVECLSDPDCPLGRLCDTATNRCEPGCTFAHGCPSTNDACCDGACLDVSADPLNCGTCGLPCSGLCRDLTCTYPRSCDALHTADPTRPSGVYSLDPEGDGSTEHFYCDMTTDGGGWTLVARVVASDAQLHVTRFSAGVLDTPTQVTTGKLSDETIDALRGDLGTSVLRLECGAHRAYFQAGAQLFDASSPTNAITRCAPAATGPWESVPAVLGSTQIGVTSMSSTGCDPIQFADTVLDGCVDDGVAADGTLWVRTGAALPATGCAALHESSPALGSGVYDIDPDGSGPRPMVRAYCDMVTDGGGWTYGMIVRVTSGSAGRTRVAGYSAFGTASAPGPMAEYGIDLSGMRFREVRIDNFTRPATVDARLRATLTWGGTEFSSIAAQPAMRIWTGGAYDLRAGYATFDPGCVMVNESIPVCLADADSIPGFVCDTDARTAQGMLDCQGGEHCGQPVGARAWSDSTCVSYASGPDAVYGLAVR